MVTLCDYLTAVDAGPDYAPEDGCHCRVCGNGFDATEPTALCHDCAQTAVALMAEALSRLPKTADGVPITPGMKLYLRDYPYTTTAGTRYDDDDFERGYYSTADAAKADAR